MRQAYRIAWLNRLASRKGTLETRPQDSMVNQAGKKSKTALKLDKETYIHL